MTFNEWWETLTTREQNGMDKQSVSAAWELGKLEAAQHILDMWNEPWPVTQKTFIDRLKSYVEELK